MRATPKSCPVPASICHGCRCLGIWCCLYSTVVLGFLSLKLLDWLKKMPMFRHPWKTDVRGQDEHIRDTLTSGRHSRCAVFMRVKSPDVWGWLLLCSLLDYWTYSGESSFFPLSFMAASQAAGWNSLAWVLCSLLFLLSAWRELADQALVPQKFTGFLSVQWHRVSYAQFS